MFGKPQAQHEWFNDLIGNWEFSHECSMGPDQPVSTTSGTVVGRSLSGLWTVLEFAGETPEHGQWTSLYTLGFDPRMDRFVATFVASMMTHLWVYEGQLDDSGKVLTLDVEGPRFDGEGLVRYQDSIEIVDPDHWVLRSRILGDDGQWHSFMEGHHRRV
ncbi:MAG: DUF1579 domain-containing protein [Fuerstiella sp.]